MNKNQTESDTTETEMSGSDAGVSELRFRAVILCQFFSSDLMTPNK